MTGVLLIKLQLVYYNIVVIETHVLSLPVKALS
jgi:hypothetical protein